MTVYDSLGAAHTASTYFVNTGGSTWDAYEYIDGTKVNTTPVALTYSNSGALTSVADAAGGTNPAAVSFGSYTPTTGAAALNVSFNLSDSTQYGDTFGVNLGDAERLYHRPAQRRVGEFHRRGPGQLHQRQSTALGQVAVANFANEQGLQQVGNTNWVQTFASGQPVNGQAGGSGVGLIESGSLEESNVDITHSCSQHDHGAARVSGQRRDGLDRERDHADRHQTSRPSSKGLRHSSNGPSRLRGHVGRKGKPCAPRPRNNHNLANANTNGFRADLSAFQTQNVTGAGLPSRAYATSDVSGWDSSSGSLDATGRDLDRGGEGDSGWIAVQANDGTEAYTRAGDLRVDPSGALTTATGNNRARRFGADQCAAVIRASTSAATVSVSIVAARTDGGRPYPRVGRIQAGESARGLSSPVANDGLFRSNSGADAESDATVHLMSGTLESSQRSILPRPWRT